MDEELQAHYARSFRGKLYMLAVNQNIPLRLSRSSDKFTFGFTPEDDWLQAGGRHDSPVMDFNFHSHTDDRLHYHICIPGRPHIKKLGISRNGYLGFYWHAEVTDYLKVEPLQQTHEGLVCHLRDHLGNLVRAIKDNPHKSGDWVACLNVQDGELFPFLLKQID